MQAGEEGEGEGESESKINNNKMSGWLGKV